jgi:hypothetical protein
MARVGTARRSTESKRPAANELLRSISSVVDRLAKTVDVLRDTVARTADATTEDQPIQPAAIHSLFEAVQVELASPDTPVLGMGFFPNPAASADGADVHWWYQSSNGRPLSKLRVATKPQHIDFYDYGTAPWWLGAINSEALNVTGPYVDYNGTNAYVVTFSRSVQQDGVPLGVIALDVPVGKLQSIWQSALLKLPRPTSVVDHDGLVIATNSGRLLGGTLRLAGDRGRVLPVPRTTWRIVISADAISASPWETPAAR